MLRYILSRNFQLQEMETNIGKLQSNMWYIAMKRPYICHNDMGYNVIYDGADFEPIEIIELSLSKTTISMVTRTIEAAFILRTSCIKIKKSIGF